MWRLWHKLFGWEYITVEWAYGFVIARAYVWQNKLYFKHCGLNKIGYREWSPLTKGAIQFYNSLQGGPNET